MGLAQPSCCGVFGATIELALIASSVLVAQIKLIGKGLAAFDFAFVATAVFVAQPKLLRSRGAPILTTWLLVAASVGSAQSTSQGILMTTGVVLALVRSTVLST